MLRSCKKYLGFDDRWLMLIGIPLLSLLTPVLLNLEGMHDGPDIGYWNHHVPESVIFVLGFWLCFRWLMIFSRKHFTEELKAKKRLFFIVTSVLLSAPILKWCFAVCSNLILACFGEHNHAMPSQLTFLITIYLPSFLIIAIYEAGYYFMRYQQALIDRERIEAKHLETQLTNLRNQINPHFLFNSLNTLMNLIPTDPDRATLYLSKLSKFYRYAVGEKHDEKLIPLSKEIEFAHLYADLLRERFNESLDVTIDVAPSSDMVIPPLTIQLLMENAVKHNVVSQEHPLKISISYSEAEKSISVVNNKQRKITSVSSTGVGLVNIKKRFELFKCDGEVSIIEDADNFKVLIPIICK